MTAPLLSPVTRAPLVEQGADFLRDSDGSLWPVVDGIPYLRVGRDALVAETVERLHVGDRAGALRGLLADQDDWWPGGRPADEALGRLVDDQARLSLREAMDLLGFDRVGHYFAHRWSDPTYLAGLGLLEAHWRDTASAFELACGIGHYGRDLMRRGVRFTGGDVVFSKLWLARRWVLPEGATLVCFDAAAPWPVMRSRFDLVFCHDAFYFLEPKAAIIAHLRTLAEPNGRVAISHIHNAAADNLSAGRAMAAEAVAGMFPEATVYDDAELTRALVERRMPRPATPDRLGGVEAFSLEDKASGPPRPLGGGIGMPAHPSSLRLNPLYRRDADGVSVAWPSTRYATEYGGRATFPSRLPEALIPGPDDADAVRRRILVDLPERW